MAKGLGLRCLGMNRAYVDNMGVSENRGYLILGSL